MLFEAGDRSPCEPTRRVDRCEPRGSLRPAAQARAVAGALGRRSARVKSHVLALRRPDGTDGSTINPGRRHRGEETTIETPVAGAYGAIAGIGIENHARRLAASGGGYSPFSDIDI